MAPTYRWPVTLPTPAFLAVAAALLFVFALTACGNDDDADAPAATPPAASDDSDDTGGMADDGDDAVLPGDDDGDDGQAAPGGSGAGGRVVFDGTSYAIGDVTRCEPFMDDDDLDMWGSGPGIQVFVYITDNSQEVGLQGSAVGLHDGSVFTFDGSTWMYDDGEELDTPPLDWSGNRVEGSMRVMSFDDDSWSDVTIDLEVPSSITDC